MSFQTILVVGYLGRDPELRYTPAGTAVVSFSIATDRTYTKDEQEVKEVTWFRVTAWGKQAETCNQYLAKGSQVLVEGKLVPDPTTGGPKLWQGKDGSWKANFDINANTVRFLSTKLDTPRQQDGDMQQDGF
jgi:single-strand DNA-binding protein